MSITDVLNKSIGDDCSVNTIRKLILARTAQILDAMSSPPAEDN
jgi:hypothetical protein